jgi:hypothetical protein
MKEDNEVKEIGTLDVIYEGQPTKIRIQAEIHIEDVDKQIVLYMFILLSEFPKFPGPNLILIEQF